jgi:hypothetical protein
LARLRLTTFGAGTGPYATKIDQENQMINKAEADRILRRWADVLCSHLGELPQATGDTKTASKGS